MASEMVAIKQFYEPEIREKNPVGRPAKNSGKLPEFQGDTRDIVAKYVDISGRTMEKAESIVEAAEGEIEPKEKRLGADNKTYTPPTSANKEVEPDPFVEWFSERASKLGKLDEITVGKSGYM